MIWKPESESTKIVQYFVLGNIILIIALMELLPLWFRYQYRVLINFLEKFAEVYNEKLSYSYTPVVVIKSKLQDKTQPSYLSDTRHESDKTFFTISHDNTTHDFVTNITKKEHLSDLASVIIYYLKQDIPYEILYEHSKRISPTL